VETCACVIVTMEVQSQAEATALKNAEKSLGVSP